MSEELVESIKKKSPYKAYGNDWELDFNIWLEQRAIIKAKRECFWTKKDRQLMTLTFDEFRVKVLKPFEKFLERKTINHCGRCGRPMPQYRTKRKVTTIFCRECNAFLMGKNNQGKSWKKRHPNQTRLLDVSKEQTKP
jgi:formylmethanofuran dehydrogenase subunit E